MKATANVIRGVVSSWLRYQRRCPLVTFERSLHYGNIPDILALTESRHLIEIEIKVSFGDFKRDANKQKWQWKYFPAPKQFYYAVPSGLAEKIREQLPPGAGLIVVEEEDGGPLDAYTSLPMMKVMVGAKNNSEARKVSIKTAIKMVWNQSGTLCSIAVKTAHMEKDDEERISS